ncbi:hypothetical protein [Halomarina ordinaria]|uniref:DUF8151 domain-containing protein n=1 Tax=Halomarina ordinaria TaxID=3033939 RepID=A0ABD5UD22_9EURY|nr:hypothetical protein [Halomarina sp. PSRA2]
MSREASLVARFGSPKVGTVVFVLVGLAFLLLGTVQYRSGDSTMGLWWTLVGVVHLVFGVAVLPVVPDGSPDDLPADD